MAKVSLKAAFADSLVFSSNSKLSFMQVSIAEQRDINLADQETGEIEVNSEVS